MSKKIVFWICRSNFKFELLLENLCALASLIKSFHKIAQTGDQTSEFSFEDVHFFFGDITLLCLQIVKMWTTWLQTIFVGASANSNCSMLGLGKVKNIVVEKLSTSVSSKNSSSIFFVKWKKFQKLGICFLTDVSFRYSVEFFQNEFLGVVPVKTMRISNFNDSNNFNQSDSKISLRIIRFDAVV